MNRYVVVFSTVRHDTVAAEDMATAVRIVRQQLKSDEHVLGAYVLGEELPAELEPSKHHLPRRVP